MKKALVTLVVLGLVGASGYAYYRYGRRASEPTVTTALVTRGDIAETVGATGTLQAVTTVQVGTQVSGTILELNADFNSLVRKGQVLARLDPSLFQTQIEQARANLIRAQADLERLKVALEDAQTKLTRARELAARQLIPRTELDTAEVNVRSAEAQIRSSQAQVTQAQASLSQTEVNLDHTVIQAPIDGLVISRNVDIGQTVAASMQAPTLFVLAADLTKMQVLANLDESDVGRIRPRQIVTFRVDAYPAEDFTGTVSQVRLQAIVQQNVVTYATVIDVPNPELKLKPGMTANVNVEIARASNVVRVPNAALRFRPTNEMYAALGQTPPEQPGGRAMGSGGGTGSGDGMGAADGRGMGSRSGTGQGGGRGNGSSRASTSEAPVPGDAVAKASQPPASGSTPTENGTSEPSAADRSGTMRGRRQGTSGAGGGTMAGIGGEPGAQDPETRARMMERMESLPPDQREDMMRRLRGRGVDSIAAPDAQSGGAERPRERRGDRGAPRGDAAPPRTERATTIDALFGPLAKVESTGRAWIYAGSELKAIRLRLGISDGQATELLEGDLEPGTELVTNVTTGNETRPALTGPGAFPFMGQPGRGGDFRGPGGFGGPPGGFGGGGGSGGRGR